MRAVFMCEIGGRLIELERRDIPNCIRYTRVITKPLESKIIAEMSEIKSMVTAQKEVWYAASLPTSPRDFAVFLLEAVV